MKHFSVIAFLVVLALTMMFAKNASAALQVAQSNSQCNEKKTVVSGRVVPVVCIADRIYRINYDQSSRKILLERGGVKTVLQRIPAGHDPSLVGTDVFIGFLADALQVYKEDNVLMYISTMRTNGGGGAGQCGAGSEIYLNFLDVKSAVPKERSRILIGSCAESIELEDQDISSRVLGNITSINKSISFRFLNYKNFDGSPSATVAPDFSQLLFGN